MCCKERLSKRSRTSSPLQDSSHWMRAASYNNLPMLTEAKTYNGPDATTIAPAARPLTSRYLRDYLSRPAQFLAIVVQFALIAVVVGQWQLESQLLSRLMWLAFFGFIVHHLLPRRLRLPFFAMLSLVAVITELSVTWLRMRGCVG